MYLEYSEGIVERESLQRYFFLLGVALGFVSTAQATRNIKEKKKRGDINLNVQWSIKEIYNRYKQKSTMFSFKVVKCTFSKITSRLCNFSAGAKNIKEHIKKIK